MPRIQASPSRTASTVLRTFSVLDLFSHASPVIGIDDLVAKLGYTRSTAYRYMAELVDAGLVSPNSGGSYSLGPRIIELERLAALTDPLYRAGREVLESVADSHSTLLLHSLYGEKVLCIYKAGPDVLESQGRRITIRRARGIPFPLFQGAASLAMLSHLPSTRIQQTYLRNASAIAAAGLGEDWESYRRGLLEVRRAGYAVSNGQITLSVTGVAVPIFAGPSRRLVGSLARAYPGAAPPYPSEAECAEQLHTLSALVAAAYVRAAAK